VILFLTGLGNVPPPRLLPVTARAIFLRDGSKAQPLGLGPDIDGLDDTFRLRV
jgi:hypothetical protein